jgi:hypothetical protein
MPPCKLSGRRVKHVNSSVPDWHHVRVGSRTDWPVAPVTIAAGCVGGPG